MIPAHDHTPSTPWSYACPACVALVAGPVCTCAAPYLGQSYHTAGCALS